MLGGRNASDINKQTRTTTLLKMERSAYRLAVDFQDPSSKNEFDVLNRNEWLEEAVVQEQDIDPIVAAEMALSAQN